MVPVPEGTFMMGCTEGPGRCMTGGLDQPPHEVWLSAYSIDRTEVSQTSYAACVSAGACVAPASGWDPDHKEWLPVTSVSWDAARRYCIWVGKRLPTEAEWEKAARGTDERRYPWGNDAPDCTRANLAPCGGSLRNAGSLPAGASPYGALDMSGNAEEWVNDWFDSGYYATAPPRDPPGPPPGTEHVVRGGSYRDDAWHGATTVRLWDTGGPAPERGFRCAR
jgi:formylglycine-generating enzyme required for sulfatase activity